MPDEVRISRGARAHFYRCPRCRKSRSRGPWMCEVCEKELQKSTQRSSKADGRTPEGLKPVGKPRWMRSSTGGRTPEREYPTPMLQEDERQVLLKLKRGPCSGFKLERLIGKILGTDGRNLVGRLEQEGLIELSSSKVENFAKNTSMYVEVRGLRGDLLFSYGQKPDQARGVSLPVATSKWAGSAEPCELLVWARRN